MMKDRRREHEYYLTCAIMGVWKSENEMESTVTNELEHARINTFIYTRLEML